MKKNSVSIESFADVKHLPFHATFYATSGIFQKVELKHDVSTSWDLFTDSNDNTLEILQEWLFAYFHNRALPALSLISPKSSFANDVFRVISAIPKGSTISYKQVATALGKRSFRAVGQALGANLTPLLIPCHRVIQENGSLGGFRDGPSVKKELLSLERKLFSLK